MKDVRFFNNSFERVNTDKIFREESAWQRNFKASNANIIIASKEKSLKW